MKDFDDDSTPPDSAKPAARATKRAIVVDGSAVDKLFNELDELKRAASAIQSRLHRLKMTIESFTS